MDENVVNHSKQNLNLRNIIQGYEGISKTWTKLDFFGKVCQTTTWYYKEKSAKQASWPRRDLPLLFSVQQLVRNLSHLWLASWRCHELSTNSCLIESSRRQSPKHGWQERYFWNIFRNSTPKCKLRTGRPLFFSTMLLVIQKWSFPTSSLFSFHQTHQQGPSLWTLESYKTLMLNIARCSLNFFNPMQMWLL